MKIEGLILAAGLSSRFPGYKMEQLINGKTIIEWTVHSMSPYVDRILVVTGFNHQVIESLLKDYEKVECIYNDVYEQGMFSSILKGVSHLKGDQFFVTPGDCPCVKDNTYEMLLEAEGEVVIPSFDFKAGHPIRLSREVREKLLVTKAEHLRAFLLNYEKVYVNVTDDGILKDIDTEEDYIELKGRLSNENH